MLFFVYGFSVAQSFRRRIESFMQLQKDLLKSWNSCLDYISDRISTFPPPPPFQVIDKYAEEAVTQKLEPEEVPDDGDKVMDERSEEDESEGMEEEREEDDDNNYIDNVISDVKKATSSCK